MESTLQIFRLVAGAWCILCLVLVSIYNSVLISYVTSTPRVQPLIDSTQDLLAKPQIQLVVMRGLGPEAVFLV